MNRLTEAEPMLRQALAVDENNSGPEHPSVARDLNSLAEFLQATNRLDDAESLLHRALAIDEKSLVMNHPDIARDLNSLAALYQVTHRAAEAEPLRRRALGILFEFKRNSGYEHPKQAAVLEDYRVLLKEVGKSDAEIEATIAELMRPSE
jgi:tetratricopeptide (TPR) repeat protein